MKTLKIGFLVVVVMVIVGMGVKIIKHKIELNNKEQTPKIYPIKVDVLNVKNQNHLLSLPYLADVKNENSVILSTKFAGKIEYIKNLGDKVKKGDIVVKIDNNFLKSKLIGIETQLLSLTKNIDATKIALNNLIDNHKRTKKLVAVKIASVEKYNNESTQIAQTRSKLFGLLQTKISLEAQKQSLLNDINYLTLKAPIDGIISQKFFNLGNNIFSGKTILKISPPNGNYLYFSLPNKVDEIIFDNKIYKVTDLNIALNGLKTYKVKVKNNLIEGQKVDIRVVTFNGNGVFIPYDSILSVDGKNYVLIPQNNKALPKEITIIARGDKGVIIKENISKIIKANSDILLRLKAGYPYVI